MAHTELKTAKSGKQFYKIRISSGRKQRYSTQWYIPEDLTKKAASPVARIRQKAEKDIADGLAVAIAQFEQDIAAGKLITREQKATQKRSEELEKAKIKTLRQFCDQDFIPSKELIEGCSSGTIAFYKAMLKHIYNHKICDFPLREITPIMIKQMLMEEQKAGASSDMLIRIYKTLLQVFNKAEKLDLVSYSPMTKVERPKLSKQQKAEKDIEFLTAEQLRMVMDAAKNDYLKAENRRKERSYYKWYMFICLATFSGMRRGEICGLEWKDIDFANNVIRIRQHVVYNAGTGLEVAAATKNGHSRSIPVDNTIIGLLHDYKQYLGHADDTQFIFVQEDGITPLSPQSVTAYFKDFGEAHNLEGLHCHLLRHSFATLMLQSGGDLASVSAILGHSSTDITARTYIHSNMSAQRKASSLFSSALKNAEQDALSQLYSN